MENKDSGTSDFKNVGVAWRQSRSGKTFYNVRFDQDVFEEHWADLLSNGCILIKNKFKENDRQPDLLFRFKVGAS